MPQREAIAVSSGQQGVPFEACFTRPGHRKAAGNSPFYDNSPPCLRGR